MEIGQHQNTIIVMLGLFLFGIGYNALVGYLEASGGDRGITAFLVVGGTLVTLGGAAFLIGLDTALLTLALFAASGLPMIVGSWMRHDSKRRIDEQKARAMAQELLGND